MATIIPFKAIRPEVNKCAKIAALPYDVYNRSEAKEVVLANPDSFLAIDRAETSFPDDVDTYDERVYKKAHDMLWDRIEKGDFVCDSNPYYYIYELIMDGRSQTGIVACASIDDYQNKHLSLTEVCLKYDIDKSTVQRWCQRYRLSGPTALITGVDKANVRSYMGRPKKTTEQMTEFERLQKENQELKTEIALLKKVRALVEERNARLRENGQGPSKN